MSTAARGLSDVSGTTPLLLPHHLAHLRASAISDEVIRARGYRTVHRDSAASTASHDLLKRCGIPGWARREPARYPGILMPTYRATGEQIGWQYRPDSPPRDPQTGKARKYAAQVGRSSVVDVHPHNAGRIADPTVPLWLTEGVKKGDALTTAGACVATLSGVYNWRSPLGSLGDWEDIPLKGREVFVCFDNDATTNPNVAAAMGRLGKWLKSKGAKAVHYVVTPAEVSGAATKGADDFLAAGGTLAGLRAVASATPPEVTRLDDEFSDARLAELVADEVFADRFCWTAGLGWMEYTGVRWRRCEEAAAIEAVRVYFVDTFRAAASGGVPGHRLKSLLALESRSRILAVVNLTRGIVLRDAADFDADPELLNTPSGVVDLETMKVLPHDPSVLITKVTSVGYWPGATSPDWTAALAAVPAGIADWYQLRLGQGLTGHTPPDDLLLVCQGGGENGKTTVNGTVAHVLGDYAVLVSDRVLLADPSAHPTELMELRGARLALVEETPEARRLSVSRLKKVVGTPWIEARYICRDSVTFRATHTLILSTNYRPVVEESDHGTWRRLALVRFPFRFLKAHQPIENPDTDRHGDPLLRQRLLSDEAGQEAVLAWLVEGAYRWYQAGRVMPELPPAVAADTDAWRAEADLLLAYARERLVFDQARHVMSTELLQDFNAWAQARGHQPWSDRTFAARFEAHAVLARHKVDRRKVRHAETLSRMDPPQVPLPIGWAEVPATYSAWRGVRFATRAEQTTVDDSEESARAAPVPGVPRQKYGPKMEIPHKRTFLSAHSEHPAPDQGEHVPSVGCENSIRDTSDVESAVDENQLDRELHALPLVCQTCNDPERLAIRFGRPWWVVACREHCPFAPQPAV